MRRGKTFIICGPSGVGKGTVVARLLASDPKLYFSVSATTRPPRPGEVDGKHYHFLSREQFQRWIDEDAFLEHAEFVGNLYGDPQALRGQGHGPGPGRDIGHRDPGGRAGPPQAARGHPHLRGPAQLGGAGAPAHRPGHRRIWRRSAAAWSGARRSSPWPATSTTLSSTTRVDRAVEELRAILLAEHWPPGRADHPDPLRDASAVCSFLYSYNYLKGMMLS